MTKFIAQSKCQIGDSVFLIQSVNGQTQITGPFEVLQVNASFNKDGLIALTYRLKNGGISYHCQNEVKTNAEMIEWHKEKMKKA